MQNPIFPYNQNGVETWEYISNNGPLNTRLKHSMTSTHNALYVYGGVDSESPTEIFNDLWEYQINDGIWTQYANGPSLYDTNLIYYKEKLYAVGGKTNTSGSKTLEINVYDINDESWSTLTSIPEPSYSYESIRADIINDEIYCIILSSSSDIEVYSYSLSTNQWNTSLLGSTYTRYNAMVTTDHEKFYIVSGYDNNDDIDSIIITYDVYRNSWEQLSDLPTNIIDGTVSIINDKLYVFGGVDENNNPNTQTFIYNKNNDTWNNGSISQNGIVNGSSTTINNNIYLFGGLQSSVSKQLLRYKPQVYNHANIIYENDEIEPRENSSVNIIGNTMYIHGGSNENETFNDFWKINLYDFSKEKLFCELSSGANKSSINVGNDIFFLGGEGLTEFKKYNTINGTWEELSSYTNNDEIINATLVYNGGEIVVFGYETSDSQITSIASYDISSDAWSEEQTSSFTFNKNNKVFRIDDKLYLVTINEIISYDIDLSSPQTVTTIEQSLTEFVCYKDENYINIISTEVDNDILSFNINKETWTSTPLSDNFIPITGVHNSCTFYDNSVYIFGGNSSDDVSVYYSHIQHIKITPTLGGGDKSVEEITTTGDSYVVGAPHTQNKATMYDDDTIYALSLGDTYNELYRYTISTSVWTNTGINFPEIPLNSKPLIFNYNSILYIFGGEDNTLIYDYDPNTDTLNSKTFPISSNFNEYQSAVFVYNERVFLYIIDSDGVIVYYEYFPDDNTFTELNSRNNSLGDEQWYRLPVMHEGIIYVFGENNGYALTYDVINDDFSSVPDTPEEARHASATVHGERIYAFQGYDGDAIYEFNLNTSTWSTVEGLTLPGTSTSSFSLDDSILVIDDEGVFKFNTPKIYDGSCEVKVQHATVPPLYGHIQYSHGDFITILGGYDNDENINNNAYRYDYRYDTWSIIKSDSIIHRVYSSFKKVDDKVYIIGGIDSTGEQVDDFISIDIETLNSEELTALPETITNSSLEYVNGNLYVFGGVQSDDTISSDLYEYSIDDDIWTTKTHSIPAVKDHASLSYNDELYIINGFTDIENTTPSFDVYSYDPSTETTTQHTSQPENESEDENYTSFSMYNPRTDDWEFKTPHPSQNKYSGMSIVDEKIFEYGGIRNDTAQNRVEQYAMVVAQEAFGYIPTNGNTVNLTCTIIAGEANYPDPYEAQSNARVYQYSENVAGKTTYENPEDVYSNLEVIDITQSLANKESYFNPRKPISTEKIQNVRNEIVNDKFYIDKDVPRSDSKLNIAYEYIVNATNYPDPLQLEPGFYVSQNVVNVVSEDFYEDKDSILSNATVYTNALTVTTEAEYTNPEDIKDLGHVQHNFVQVVNETDSYQSMGSNLKSNGVHMAIAESVEYPEPSTEEKKYPRITINIRRTNNKCV